MNLLDDVCGYSLDSEQRSVVYSSEKHVLVVAGAGSGKTLTILGKIRYLIEEEGISPEMILCISFTNASVSSLKKKLSDFYGYSVSVYTFHKLSLEILGGSSSIAPSDLLEYTVTEYFYGVIFENDLAMKRVLRYFHMSTGKNIVSSYQKLLREKPIASFISLISKFLHLFKAQSYSLEVFYHFFLENHRKYFFWKSHHDDLFLMIAWDIYLLYSEELKASGMIDFDDMIQNATEVVRSGKIFPYRYVIIDEYQDTSYTKFLLIREILEKTGASLLAVGDDFQSIYQFAGSNIHMFLDFSKYFPDSHTYYLTNTYRNSQELIDIAGSFIMKNPRQIRKVLTSSKHFSSPIEIHYTENPSLKLKKILDSLLDSDTIFLLGRNQADIFFYLDSEFSYLDGKVTYFRRPSLNIEFMTIHRSKGLEADVVIVLHLVEDVLGFPSQMVDDPIIQYVLKTSDIYPNEEERRLFYVALTRCKNKVYLLSNKKYPSRFLKEISHDFSILTYNEM